MSEKIEVKYTGGLGSFFYAAIPSVLGGAALMWLAFVSGCLDLHQQRTIAQRMDNRVGVVEKLDKPVTLVIEQKGCLNITRAYLDGADNSTYETFGGKLTAYITNTCSKTPSYLEFHWKELSPDGTIIQSGFENYSVPHPNPKETAELLENLPDDSRVTKVVVWISAANF